MVQIFFITRCIEQRKTFFADLRRKGGIDRLMGRRFTGNHESGFRNNEAETGSL